MSKGQLINLVFIILGMSGSIYGLYSILYRNLKTRIEKDILISLENKIKNT